MAAREADRSTARGRPGGSQRWSDACRWTISSRERDIRDKSTSHFPPRSPSLTTRPPATAADDKSRLGGRRVRVRLRVKFLRLRLVRVSWRMTESIARVSWRDSRGYRERLIEGYQEADRMRIKGASAPHQPRPIHGTRQAIGLFRRSPDQSRAHIRASRRRRSNRASISWKLSVENQSRQRHSAVKKTAATAARHPQMHRGSSCPIEWGNMSYRLGGIHMNTHRSDQSVEMSRGSLKYAQAGCDNKQHGGGAIRRL